MSSAEAAIKKRFELTTKHFLVEVEAFPEVSSDTTYSGSSNKTKPAVTATTPEEFRAYDAWIKTQGKRLLVFSRVLEDDFAKWSAGFPDRLIMTHETNRPLVWEDAVDPQSAPKYEAQGLKGSVHYRMRFTPAVIKGRVHLTFTFRSLPDKDIRDQIRQRMDAEVIEIEDAFNLWYTD